MRYDNIAKAKELIDTRRKNALAEADRRNAEVAARSAVIKEIDKELSLTGPAIFKAACRGEGLDEIKARNIELNEARRREIVKLGLPIDYTDVHYFCPDCSDTGFIGGSKICSCFKRAIAEESMKASGIGSLVKRQTFDNLDLEWYKSTEGAYERMVANVAAAKRFAETFSKTGETLVLLGTTGTGKTHISTAIARVAIEGGYEVVYDSSQNIIADFEHDRFKSGYGQYEPRADKYTECDLLIIDDLGTEFINQFTISTLYNLLNTRQNRGLATVISTNFTEEDLCNKYEARIVSRLFGESSEVLVFRGKDYRIFSRLEKK